MNGIAGVAMPITEWLTDAMRTVAMDRGHHDPRTLTAYTGEMMSPGWYVYYLWLGPDLVYVGKAVELGRRVGAHRRTKRFDRVTYAVLPDEWSMLARERSEIARWHPPLNKVGGVYWPESWRP